MTDDDGLPQYFSNLFSILANFWARPEKTFLEKKHKNLQVKFKEAVGF